MKIRGLGIINIWRRLKQM